jgi:hypothetical protein
MATPSAVFERLPATMTLSVAGPRRSHRGPSLEPPFFCDNRNLHQGQRRNQTTPAENRIDSEGRHRQGVKRVDSRSKLALKHRSELPIGSDNCGSEERSLKFASVVANKARHSLGNRSRTNADYVTRRFNASSARLNKPQGLDLRWKAALRDLQNATGTPSQPK